MILAEIRITPPAVPPPHPQPQPSVVCEAQPPQPHEEAGHLYSVSDSSEVSCGTLLDAGLDSIPIILLIEYTTLYSLPCVEVPAAPATDAP